MMQRNAIRLHDDQSTAGIWTDNQNNHSRREHASALEQDQRDFVLKSGLMVAAAGVADKATRTAEAAFIDEVRPQTADFIERVCVNQQKLTSDLKAHYDFIVCGSGSSGSVVARRLAENPNVSVLLLEAGGSDDVLSVMDAGKWITNLGTERDWGFQARPNPALNGRALRMSMGKVLGGGSSINVMYWARPSKRLELFRGRGG
jgi:hypothetical protein